MPGVGVPIQNLSTREAVAERSCLNLRSALLEPIWPIRLAIRTDSVKEYKSEICTKIHLRCIEIYNTHVCSI